VADDAKSLADGENYIDRVQSDDIVKSLSESAKLADGRIAALSSNVARILPVLHERVDQFLEMLFETSSSV
jgi:hypothetical protein